MTSGPLARVGAAIGAGAAALALLLAVSTRAGGPVSFVVTHGGSMLPGITPGTFVVLVDRGSYDVGDVVAYRDPQLRQTVLHRVVSTDGDRLVLQGDANSWLDPHRPRPDEVLGQRAWQLRGAAPAVARLAEPGSAGVVAAALALLLLGSRAGRRRRSSSRRTARATTTTETEQHVHEDDVWWERVRYDEHGAPWYLHAGTWYDHAGQPESPERDAAEAPQGPTAARLLPDTGSRAAAGALAACLALTAVAMTTPTEQRTITARPAGWSADLQYAASAARGATYPDGRVMTGEPVFAKLVRRVDVTARLSTTLPPGVSASGTWRLVTEVSDETGWSRVVSTTPPGDLGEGARLRAELLPAALMAVAETAARETGADPGRRTVTVRAVADLVLASGVSRTSAPLSPALAFEMDAASLRPAAGDASAARSGTLVVPVAEVLPGRLRFGPVSLPVAPTRRAGVALVLVALCALVASRRRTADPAAAERALVARSRGLVLELAPGQRHQPHLPVVDVASLQVLLELARRYDRVVLQESVAGRTAYVLPEDGLLYRWTSPDRAEQRAASGAGTEPAASAGDDAHEPPPTIPSPRAASESGAAAPATGR